VVPAILALLPAIASAAVSAVDDTGRTITLTAPAQRIVSLSPHLTELLFAAGAGARITGTVNHSDFPDAARAIPRIGDAHHLDLERILTLRPDLVVAWGSGNPPQAIAKIRAFGIPVYVSEPDSLPGIADNLEELGRLAGSAATAAVAAVAFHARLEDLERRYSGTSTVSMFYAIWHRPLMTVGGNHLISTTIELCGGKNIFTGFNTRAASVNVEDVLAAAPAVIIASGAGAEPPPWLNEWRRFSSLPATRDGHLYAIPPDLLQRHTPRILDGVERVCGYLDRARAPS
jgi:iron complex transport system substrate-binding protein